MNLKNKVVQKCDIDRHSVSHNVQKIAKSIHIQKTCIIAAPQQMCNMLHKNLKEKTMFDFTKTTKQFEELAERIKEVNEFWFNSVLSATKDLFKSAKTK
jgi:protein required for attachment to host cells